MLGFSGFPEGKLKVTPIPDLFFSDLLPLVDDLIELKVTLHCLWLFRQRGDDVPCVTASKLEEDDLLMRSLLPTAAREARARLGLGYTERQAARDALCEGLERAVARGTLLQVTAQRADRQEEVWYLLNSERGRQAVARMERGEWMPEDEAGPIHLSARRPNIFNLYEQNLGLIRSPLLAEELMDAERSYPGEWIEEAFRIAVANNVRRWAYVRRILERWAEEGRGHRRGEDDKTAGRRYADGKYADLIEH